MLASNPGDAWWWWCSGAFFTLLLVQGPGSSELSQNRGGLMHARAEGSSSIPCSNALSLLPPWLLITSLASSLFGGKGEFLC